MSKFNIFVATEEHLSYVDVVLNTIAEAAKVRGTGIAKRNPEYLQKKIEEGKAILALHQGEFAGFCYIETWGHDKFVANSGLIVVDSFRGNGLAKAIKTKAFELSRKRYPQAKIFGLTTGLAVMKINSDLGYRPVTFSELTDDEQFWKGCQSCVNYDILLRTERKHCLCTGMLYDPMRASQKTSKPASGMLSRLRSAVKKRDSKGGRFFKGLTALF
ncbi:MULTISPECIES: GNAT family N-acetyltransferase [unclassified Carboxylicivirga]|uniref:GNAT family N-acetyltransferase n=1 Tax=Carboxylicivirga TaxID=1628153 RepID=UPI003D34A766